MAEYADGHTFNFLSEAGYTYLVVADQDTGRDLAYGYLQRIKVIFQRQVGVKAQNAAAHSLNTSFAPKLKRQMEHCMTNPQDVTKIEAVKK